MDLLISSVINSATNPKKKKLKSIIINGWMFGKFINDIYINGEWKRYKPNESLDISLIILLFDNFEKLMLYKNIIIKIVIISLKILIYKLITAILFSKINSVIGKIINNIGLLDCKLYLLIKNPI